MPGGMGGMGGLAGMLLGGGGGMGGGMGGMRGMGGMNQTQTSTSQTAGSSNEYDVDRWQRADGLDAGSPTLVQTVRADWEEKTAEKEEKNPLKRLAAKFRKKKASPDSSASAEEHRPSGGTIVMPEMKKAQRSHPEPMAVTAPVAPLPVVEQPAGRNYLGLSTPSELDSFFTHSPLNSAFLAVDCLGLGYLTLNQVTSPAEPLQTPVVTSCPPAETPLPVTPVAAQTATAGMPTPGPNARQNFITQRSETRFMDEFHQSREQQKYQVRMN